MQQKPPIIDLDYRTVQYASPRGDQTVAYMISVAMAAGAVFILAALIEIIFDHNKSGPDVIARLFARAIFGGIGAVIASNIFRQFSGPVRTSPRLIVILGAINGLVGMGAFMLFAELDNFQLLGHAAFSRDAILLVNFLLPISMGLIKRIIRPPART